MQTKRQNPSEANGAGNGFRKMENAKSVPARKSKSERVQKNPWDSPRFIKRPIGGSGEALPKKFLTLSLYGKRFPVSRENVVEKRLFHRFFSVCFDACERAEARLFAPLPRESRYKTIREAARGLFMGECNFEQDTKENDFCLSPFCKKFRILEKSGASMARQHRTGILRLSGCKNAAPAPCKRRRAMV